MESVLLNNFSITTTFNNEGMLKSFSFTMALHNTKICLPEY